MTAPSQFPNVGKLGEALTLYRLRQLNIKAEEIGGNLPFDILAIHNDKPIRVQVKATSTYRSPNRFRFLTWRGRFSADQSRPITEYSANEADLVALVALPLEAVIFRHVSQVGPVTTVDKAEFLVGGCTTISFYSSITMV